MLSAAAFVIGGLLMLIGIGAIALIWRDVALSHGEKPIFMAFFSLFLVIGTALVAWSQQ